MDPLKLRSHLSKLLFQDDEDDIVRFIFPVQNQPISTVESSHNLNPVPINIVDNEAKDENAEDKKIDKKTKDKKPEGKKAENKLNGKESKIENAAGLNIKVQERRDNGDGIKVRKIKGYKSLLSKVSPVFETMFNDHWNKSGYEMDDPVDFDQFEAFQLFLEVVYGIVTVDSLTVDEAIRVHFYAHKYQMDPLIEQVRKVLTNRMKQGIKDKPYTIKELTDSIKMAELYSLNEFKEQLDHVKLEIMEEVHALGFYDACVDHKMESLINQVVAYMESKPVDDKWPIDLVIRVLELNRTKLKEFREKTFYCRHGNSGYASDFLAFKSCTTCNGSKNY